MKGSTKIIVLIIIIIIGGLFLYSKGNSGSSEKADSSLAPRFILEDYDGNVVSSNDFKGKILVINSWASWCPFCVKELPDFGELQKAFPDEIAVIAINRAEPKSVAKDYTDSAGLATAYQFLLDPEDSFYKSIGGFSMPETIFVSAEGKLLKHKRGPMELSEMKEIIDGLLTQN